MKRLAPFPTIRWWVLHFVSIAGVYAFGRLVLGN
jgi:hypothetical protein